LEKHLNATTVDIDGNLIRKNALLLIEKGIFMPAHARRYITFDKKNPF